MKKIGMLMAALVMLMVPVIASAALFTATSGDLSASADINVTAGGQLQVILTNTSAANVLNPAGVLTALFFSVNSGFTLAPFSASLNGSEVLYGPNGGGNVGGEWAYGGGLSGAPGGATSGISSSGFGLFGGANFNGANLQDPVAVNGVNYGIVSASGTGGGNAAVTGGFALIKNQVTFLLNIAGSGTFDPNTMIDKVSFQYGTALYEPNLRVPEASTLVLMGSGLLGLVWVGRRRVRK